MDEPGLRLKRVRERLNLRYRDVEDASLRIAERKNNDEFIVALSRLSDIENKGTVPSIFRLYTLCAIYRLDLVEVLERHVLRKDTQVRLNLSLLGDASIEFTPGHSRQVADCVGRRVAICPVSVEP